MEREQLSPVWDARHVSLADRKPSIDSWLVKHEDILKQSQGTAVIDLGCGRGNNSIYLLERGYEVIACDYSEEALRSVKRYAPGAQTVFVDMRDRLPWQTDSVFLIIADLSLHYFSSLETRSIIAEIKRVLRSDGYLILRVNSVNDVMYGAGQGNLLEPYYYESEEGRKRFFDREHLASFFEEWTVLSINEEELYRYGKRKAVWEAVFQNKS
jgi:SAM-dependent methyltransferase